ncbi:hypothetical protein APSETT445_006169 [Aspergillus pseudonomiae]
MYTEKQKERTYPSLRHAQKRKPDSNQQSDCSGQPNRHAGRILPRAEIVAAEPRPEPEVLDGEDEPKGEGPVAEDGEEVVDDGFELVAAAPGEGEHDGRYQGAPDEARDGEEVLAPELLTEDCGHFVVGHDDAAEMVAQCADEDGWEDLAEVGEAEDEPFACVGWVVDVVIACDGTPRAGDAEDDGEIAQTGTAIVDAAKFAQPGSRREVPGGLSPCHADEYQGNDPGVSFVVVDESEAAKGYEEADRDDNDNTRCEWDRIAGHGDKELTSDYRGNHRVSAIDDDIQQAAKLRSPNAECIAGNCHLAQATGRTQRRGKCGNNGPKESREDSEND